MPQMNISLTEELARRVKEKVASGLYANASEVIREALRQHDRNESDLYQRKRKALEEALAVGQADLDAGRSGPLDVDAIIREADARRTQKVNRSERRAS